MLGFFTFHVYLFLLFNYLFVALVCVFFLQGELWAVFFRDFMTPHLLRLATEMTHLYINAIQISHILCISCGVVASPQLCEQMHMQIIQQSTMEGQMMRMNDNNGWKGQIMMTDDNNKQQWQWQQTTTMDLKQQQETTTDDNNDGQQRWPIIQQLTMATTMTTDVNNR